MLFRSVISPNLTLTETDVSSLPLGDAPIDVTIDPDFASQAVALSRSAFTHALHEYRGEMQAKAEDNRPKSLA